MEAQYSDTHRELIEQCKRGNARAQYRLYKLYSKAMYNICLRMMNKPEEAEDILQEAFSEAFYRLKSFRFEASFGAWLKRITVNKCINALKVKKVDLVLTDNIFSSEPGDSTETEIEKQEKKYNVQRIYDAMNRLADGYRVVFSLYMLEGYDHSEIAEILDISESTSKSQYLRAKRKLNELLQEG